MGVFCGAGKATRTQLSQVVTCWLPTVCRVPTCSTCSPSLCAAAKIRLLNQKPRSILETHPRFGCYPPLCIPSEPRHLGPVTDHYVVHQKRKDLATWTSGSNVRRWVHTQHYYLRIRRVDGAAKQTYIKVIKQTNPNELLRHRNASSPLLELWLMCIRNTPAMIKNNVPYPPLFRHLTHSFAYQSSLFSHATLKDSKDIFDYLIVIRIVYWWKME